MRAVDPKPTLDGGAVLAIGLNVFSLIGCYGKPTLTEVRNILTVIVRKVLTKVLG